MPTLFPISTLCLRLRRACHCHRVNRHPNRHRRSRALTVPRHLWSLHHPGYSTFRLSPRPRDQSKPEPPASPSVHTAKRTDAADAADATRAVPPPQLRKPRRHGRRKPFWTSKRQQTKSLTGDGQDLDPPGDVRWALCHPRRPTHGPSTLTTHAPPRVQLSFSETYTQ
jgi:hypothetical protein